MALFSVSLSTFFQALFPFFTVGTHYFHLVAESEEFILYSTRSQVYRYMFEEGQKELLGDGLSSTVTVEYDYKKNCAYWADVQKDIIQVGAKECAKRFK